MLSISKAWARATPGKAGNGAAYISISNATKTTDRLKIVKGNVAERIEIHTHLLDNGVMRMRQIDGVDLPAGGTIEMKPGGYHVMLIGLSRPLKKGGLFPLTLVFEKAGEVITQVKILSVGAMDGGEKQNKSSYGHHKHH